MMEIEMEELDKWMSNMTRNGTWRPRVLVCLSGDGRGAGLPRLQQLLRSSEATLRLAQV